VYTYEILIVNRVRIFTSQTHTRLLNGWRFFPISIPMRTIFVPYPYPNRRILHGLADIRSSLTSLRRPYFLLPSIGNLNEAAFIIHTPSMPCRLASLVSRIFVVACECGTHALPRTDRKHGMVLQWLVVHNCFFSFWIKVSCFDSYIAAILRDKNTLETVETIRTGFSVFQFIC
jgi:hypothetical protein